MFRFKMAVAILLNAAVLIPIGFALGWHHQGHIEKHTGRAQVVAANGPRFWFLRPNGEVFQMYFDNPPEVFRSGLTLDDITYTDDNADMRHLVKLRLNCAERKMFWFGEASGVIGVVVTRWASPPT
jgi:hypothetical protein